MSVEPKIDTDGKVVGVVCVGEDVAERRRVLDATMRNHQLQKTNDAKDAFLACMSHEMRTPLNGLLGMLQLAMCSSDDVPEKVRRFVEQAHPSPNPNPDPDVPERMKRFVKQALSRLLPPSLTFARPPPRLRR